MGSARRLAASLAVALALIGCGSAAASPESSAAAPAAATSSNESSAASIATPATPPSPTPGSSSQPSAVGATLCFDYPTDHGSVAQVEMAPRSGPRVYIDVADPAMLQETPTDRDILLTTHTHPDHIDGIWATKIFPGQKLIATPGRIDLADVSIVGIASGHGTEAGPAAGPDGDNIIFVVEAGGVRIVHFGDLGQVSLTAAQLDAIGRVDVAITQFSNPYSSMDASNQMGFNQMRQVHPRLIIPTHLMEDLPAAALLATTWPSAFTGKHCLDLTAGKLPASTSVLFMGYNADDWAAQLKLQPSDW